MDNNTENKEGDLRNTRGHRLSLEYEEMLSNRPDMISTPRLVNDNLQLWLVTILGPPETPYEGGVFTIRLELPERYPFEPPLVIFINKIYHCNVSEKGEVSKSVINGCWTPSSHISDLLRALCDMLKEPVREDVMRPEIAEHYRMEPEEHDMIAREWTDLFAKPLE